MLCYLFCPQSSYHLSPRKLTFRADHSKGVMWKILFSRQCIIHHGFILVKQNINKTMKRHASPYQCSSSFDKGVNLRRRYQCTLTASVISRSSPCWLCYCLFPRIKTVLKGHRFQTAEVVKYKVTGKAYNIASCDMVAGRNV
jgi:hypothetical protein